MGSEAKYMPINGGGTVAPDTKSHFSIFKIRKTTTLAYGFMFAFVAFTAFLAFAPSSNSSSPWFSNIFSLTPTSPDSASASASASDSYRSQFSSFFSHFFPNGSSSEPESRNFAPPVPESVPGRSKDGESGNAESAPTNDTISESTKNSTAQSQSAKKAHSLPKNGNFPTQGHSPSSHASPSTDAKSHTQINQNSGSKPSQATIAAAKSPALANQSTVSDSPKASSNSTSSPTNKVSDGADSGSKQTMKNWMESLMKCDFFDGNWVMDESYPLYKPGSCSLIDEQFSCIPNGRPDRDFQKLKWKPKGCTLPRLNGAHMLEMLRGKRFVFVGDSLNRNMWESLICILKGSAKDPKHVYEAHGRQHFRSEAEYSFVFKDYGFTVEFYVSPFLVQESENKDMNGKKKETLRLDLVGKLSDQYKGADIIIFNTGHWWTHEKTSKGKDYYQEGSHVYGDLNVLEAFRKALTTWSRWVDANLDPAKTLIFFRGYSATHFSGGQWNSGGQCDSETEPIKNKKYLTPYPSKMQVLERVLKGMKTPVTYLNITRLTDYRKDAHPSIYRRRRMSDAERKSPLRFQDCSHWCLPGVPDSWNEILYAELLIKLNHLPQSQRRS